MLTEWAVHHRVEVVKLDQNWLSVASNKGNMAAQRGHTRQGLWFTRTQCNPHTANVGKSKNHFLFSTFWLYLLCRAYHSAPLRQY